MTHAQTAEARPATWTPIASCEALMGARPVVPITAHGQDLVLFRDETGALGLIGRYCPHRGADLCFGRHENNGLRCPFHGWHFDRSGHCTEQPAEPADSTLYKTIKQPSFDVIEQDGVILAWFGEGQPPEPGPDTIAKDPVPTHPKPAGQKP